MVSNLDKTPIPEARVTIDRDALGLAAGDLHIEDAYLRKPVAATDDVVTLDIEPERYRLLRVWTE